MLDAWIDHYGSLAVALAIGFVIGLQRAQSAAADEAAAGVEPGSFRQLGGIRTFPLVALTGAVASLLASGFGAWVLVVAALGVMTPVAIAYRDDIARRERRGLTTETAVILTFLLGALAPASVVVADPHERWLLTATVAIAATAILSLKQPLHAIATHISREDLFAWLKFGVVAIVIVPLLPDRAYGPTEALRVLNPQKLGWMVVLIAAISLVGYVAMRLLGPNRGLGVTGFVGGFVSSTAVTLALSRRSREIRDLDASCALGVVLANSIMPVRVLVVASLIHVELARYLLAPLLGAALAGGLCALLINWRTRDARGGPVDMSLANPFELGPAIKFGLLFGVILLLARLAELHLGERGLYVAGLIAGVTDIDAITLSAAQLADSGQTVAAVAGTTILIAAASNTFFKAAVALVSGSPPFRRIVGTAFAAMVAVSVVAHLAM
jgi:uncharacterized membrane protein (DUF4010 family)